MAEYRKSDAGKRSKARSHRKWQVKRAELREELAEKHYRMCQALHNGNEIWMKKEQADRENELLKMDFFKDKVRAVEGLGNRRYIANNYAKVPLELQQLAIDLEDADPKLAHSVVKRALPKIRKQVNTLTFKKDSDSDYSQKLDRWEEAEIEERDAGMVKVPEDDWKKF